MKTNRTVRQSLAVLLAVSMAVSNVSAYARPGSVSSSSHSSVTSSRSSSAAPSSNRAGGGTNSGMVRQSAMSTARQQSPSAPSRNTSNVAPPTSNNYASSGSNVGNTANYGNNNGGGGNAPRNGFSGGQLAGAAAAGAVGGYLLHGATQSNHPVVNNNGGSGAVPAVNSQGTYGGSDYSNGSSSYAGGSSGIGGGTIIFLLLLLGGSAYLMYRVVNANSSRNGKGSARNTFGDVFAPKNNATSSGVAATNSNGAFNMPASIDNELLSNAPQLFRNIQTAYGRRDRTVIESLVDDTYIEKFAADMDSEGAAVTVKVHSVKTVGGILGFERQDERYVGSVHYLADLSEGTGPSEEVEEVWHFVRPLSGGTWRLAGIEQV